MAVRKVGAMTEDDLIEVIRSSIRAEMLALGLSVEGAPAVQEAREDFRFLRKCRLGCDSAARKIGATVLLSAVSGVVWLVWTGVSVVTRTAR